MPSMTRMAGSLLGRRRARAEANDPVGDLLDLGVRHPALERRHPTAAVRDLRHDLLWVVVEAVGDGTLRQVRTQVASAGAEVVAADAAEAAIGDELGGREL